MNDHQTAAKELFNQKKYKEAVIIYDSIYERDKNQTLDFLKEYAWCLQERLRYRESIELTLKILQQAPKDTDALLNYTICLGKQNFHKEAAEQYEKILEIDGNFSREIGYYGYLLERLGKLKEARKYYQRGLEIEPDNNWYISHYALCLQKSKQYPEAVRYFRKSLEKEPKNTWLIKRFAMLKQEVDGKDAAYRYYEDLLPQYPGNTNLYINYAELTILNNDPDKALELLKRAETIEKVLVMEIIYSFYIGFCCLIKEDYSQVEKYIEVISEKVKSYKSYIHRDFTDIEAHVEGAFNSRQKSLYEKLLTCAINA
jgi:tetratricopeptide (TPR) repeat protein